MTATIRTLRKRMSPAEVKIPLTLRVAQNVNERDENNKAVM